jgi:hypothetical protein
MLVWENLNVAIGWGKSFEEQIEEGKFSRQFKSFHVRDVNQTKEHPYPSAARIGQGRLSYEGLFSEERGDELVVK